MSVSWRGKKDAELMESMLDKFEDDNYEEVSKSDAKRRERKNKKERMDYSPTGRVGEG
ncbi:MAG: hypothetical protein Q7J72_07050 [Candidatus Omnitrophota bacterium]|nr:hypothetical protein [Candidatus Omnitrophota bacterium]